MIRRCDRLIMMLEASDSMSFQCWRRVLKPGSCLAPALWTVLLAISYNFFFISEDNARRHLFIDATEASSPTSIRCPKHSRSVSYFVDREVCEASRWLTRLSKFSCLEPSRRVSLIWWQNPMQSDNSLRRASTCFWKATPVGDIFAVVGWLMSEVRRVINNIQDSVRD